MSGVQVAGPAGADGPESSVQDAPIRNVPQSTSSGPARPPGLVTVEPTSRPTKGRSDGPSAGPPGATGAAYAGKQVRRVSVLTLWCNNYDVMDRGCEGSTSSAEFAFDKRIISL